MRILAIVSLGMACLGAAWGQTAPLDLESGSRLPLLSRADMRDEASARAYDSIAGPSSEIPRGAFAFLLYSPATGESFARIVQYLSTESALRGGRAELLMLITAREMNLAAMWSIREGTALAAGVEPQVIEAIRRNGSLDGLARDDALLIDFGRQLFRDQHVRSETFAALVAALGKQGAFDAIMLLASSAMGGVLHRAADQRPWVDWDPARLPPLPGVGTPTGRPGEFVALPERPPLPDDVYEDSYYRFPLLKRSELDARAQEIFDRAVGADRAATPRGPVGMTFLSPALVEPVQALNTALRTNGVLGTRTAEIVIAATGREMNSQYQWNVHSAAAARAGAGQAVLDAIRDDAPLTELDEQDAIAIAFTRELFREQTVRPETFAKAVRLFGERGAVEIAALVGDYLMMTTVYNALGMRMGPDQAATLPHRVGAPVGAEWR